MRISLMTIITINLSLSVLLMLLLPLLNQEFILKRLGGRQLAVCCIAVMIRALVPLEFPFSRTIRIPKVLPSIRDFLKYPVSLGSGSVKISQILLFLWMAVAMALIFRKFLYYFKMQKTVRRLPECEDKMVQETMRFLLKKYPSAQNVKVVKTALNISPFITGFKNPVIVLPGLPFTSEEYRMILEHELLHYIRHDLPVSCMTDILCSVYWWNPLFYLLRRKISELIELGNDRQLTASFSVEEKAAYMQCLFDTYKKICRSSVPFTHSFGNVEGNILRRRLHLIGSFKETKVIKSGVAISFMLLFLWGSTSFTLEPYALSETAPYITLDKYNCYIIQDNNLYKIYYQNKFMYTTDSLEYFDSDIPIYQEKGENEYE